MNGKLWGVGIGPGDPELLTLKAARLIRECDVLAVPQTSGEKNVALDIVSGAVDIKEKNIVYLPFLMQKDPVKLRENHKKSAEELAGYLRQGKMVVFITLGDVSVFSTFSYLQTMIEEMGFETEICAGVPSFCAVAAKLKTSLTTMKHPLHIIPAVHADIEELLKLDGTKVFMKAGSSLEELREAVKNQGGLSAQGAANCGMEDEKIIRDLLQDDGTGSYFTTVIVKDK